MEPIPLIFNKKPNCYYGQLREGLGATNKVTCQYTVHRKILFTGPT